MAERDHDNDPALARKRLIELLEDLDRWRFCEPRDGPSVLDQARVALKPIFGKTPSECEIIDYIVARLRANFAILRTPMGEPPGSRGIGWVMNNPDGNDTYIKLKIEERGISEIVWVMSCKKSKHSGPS